MDKRQQSAAIQELLANQPVPRGLSWGAIIIAFLVFWPVCLHMLWKRKNTVARSALKGGGLIVLLGSLSFIGAFVMLGITGGTAFSVFGAAYSSYCLFCGGMSLIFLGASVDKLARRFQNYIYLINQGVTSIDDMASAVRKSYARVSGELKKMFGMGFYQGAYVDDVLREIILPENQVKFAVDVKIDVDRADNGSEAEHPKRREAAVTCKGCGAVNKIITGGAVGTCDFCGSPISGT